MDEEKGVPAPRPKQQICTRDRGGARIGPGSAPEVIRRTFGVAVDPGASAALMWTALLLFAFRIGEAPRFREKEVSEPVHVSLIFRAEAKSETDSMNRSVLAQPHSRRLRTAMPPVHTGRSGLAETTQAPVPSPEVTAPLRASSSHEVASAPLKVDLDTASLSRAISTTKSPMRRMAEQSGTYFGDEPRSQSERLASGVASAAKGDCTGPSSGGSLLSVFVIAYMAAKDKCKW